MSFENITVGEFAARHPSALPLLKEAKVDFSCEGQQLLKEALAKNEELAKELEEIIAKGCEPDSLLNLPQQELIDHILLNFHGKHKKDLPRLIELAEKIEEVHSDHPASPKGLGSFLRSVREELLSHMNKEESVLFPIINNNPGARPLMPIRVMMAEHDDHKKTLQELENLTCSFHAPEGACQTWLVLYSELKEFADELKEHIHLENNILFPRALES